MRNFRIAAALIVACPGCVPQGQGQTEPLIADVHMAPYRASINVTINISRQRFNMRNATIVNMIDFVHDRPDDDGREDLGITGGPTWLDFDRFDVVALIPAEKIRAAGDDASRDASLNEKARAVVERILAERFHLKYHIDRRPLPGFVVAVAKDGPRLTAAHDPGGPSGCQRSRDKSKDGEFVVSCTSETIAQYIATFADTFRHPILDRTGLTKPYDFTVRFSEEQFQTREDSIEAYIDVFSKQLGLSITPGAVAQPAIVVDSVDRSPAPTPTEIAKLVPAIPELEFEVATIKPAANDEPQRAMRWSGSQISLMSFTMQDLLMRAWELRTGAMLGNRPDWLARNRYTLQLKLPPGLDAQAVAQDTELFDEMLRKLLTSRFLMKYHWGEQQVEDAYVLLAGNPKMKRADPNSRTFCKYGPAEGERDARRVGSAYDGEFHCQNVTMDQLAELTQAISEIKYRVPNETGLAGSYDFTLYYTSKRRLATDATSSDPIGGMSLEDAFRKQLGLRLVKRPGTFPSLMLDHIEETPTEN